MEEYRLSAISGFLSNSFNVNPLDKSVAVSDGFVLYSDGSKARRYEIATGESVLIFDWNTQYDEGDFSVVEGKPWRATVAFGKDGSAIVFGRNAYLLNHLGDLSVDGLKPKEEVEVATSTRCI